MSSWGFIVNLVDIMEQPSSTGTLAWEIADRVGRSHALFTAVLEEVVAPEELTVGQAIAIIVLAGSPEGLTQSEWARLQGVSRQYAHSVARRLQGRQLVTRERVGRTSKVRVTARARHLIRRLRPRTEARLATAVAGLRPLERRDLHRLLGKLADGIR